MTLAIAAIVVWIGLWALNVMLARWLPERQARIVVPIVFGLTLVLVVELLVTGLKVPFVILPKPSEMVARLFTSLPMLWEDFAQTILKGALTGYIMGCAAALFVAFLASRSDFLRRGLLPLGNFVAALPVVGLAPIMVMWFGFGWESKAAIVVSMCFFPMLVNSVQDWPRPAPSSATCSRPTPRRRYSSSACCVSLRPCPSSSMASRSAPRSP